MGKASSAKKVARAARAGGKKTGKSRQIGFPAAVGIIVVLGLALVTFAKVSGQLGEDSENPPKVGDHWHASFGVYICDHFVTDVNDRTPEDKLGIHTHADGLVHIHPFQAAGAGKQATLGKFFDQVGMKASSSRIQLPAAKPFEKRTYSEGETTCSGKPATVQLVHWKSALKAADGAKPTRTVTSNPGNVRLTEDLGAYTLAYVAKGADIPPPPASADIVQKGSADADPSQAAPQVPSNLSIPPESQGSTPASDTSPSPSESTPESTGPSSSAPPSTASP